MASLKIREPLSGAHYSVRANTIAKCDGNRRGMGHGHSTWQKFTRIPDLASIAIKAPRQKVYDQPMACFVPAGRR